MILVFSNRAHGGLQLGGYTIGGYCDALPPARIPFNVYQQHKKLLVQAPYTKQRLEEIFGGEFPNIRFNYNDIRYLEYNQLLDLCRALKITSPKRKSTDDRRGLRL
jgi:hypothetical protein